MLNKSLIQYSVDGWSSVPSVLFTWGQNMVEVMKIMVTSFQRSFACAVVFSTCRRPLSNHVSAGNCWTFTDKSLLTQNKDVKISPNQSTQILIDHTCLVQFQVERNVKTLIMQYYKYRTSTVVHTVLLS